MLEQLYVSSYLPVITAYEMYTQISLGLISKFCITVSVTDQYSFQAAHDSQKMLIALFRWQNFWGFICYINP